MMMSHAPRAASRPAHAANHTSSANTSTNAPDLTVLWHSNVCRAARVGDVLLVLLQAPLSSSERVQLNQSIFADRQVHPLHTAVVLSVPAVLPDTDAAMQSFFLSSIGYRAISVVDLGRCQTPTTDDDVDLQDFADEALLTSRHAAACMHNTVIDTVGWLIQQGVDLAEVNTFAAVARLFVDDVMHDADAPKPM